MTNEKDNDQFTNNQLNKEKDRMDCMYRFLFGYCLFLWSLEFGHYLLQKGSTSSGMKDLPVLNRYVIREAFREMGKKNGSRARSFPHDP